ncbi:23S rRNA (adenine(2030)-N(6))-methyltransferase RlmJ [Halomonas sp. TRM85114]|uniref:23S rRNA (adenine(2030)-N(6))-methyltransferase RlmJ n=1 Tax=Halomonas jincaotanensis TaxID=2810616 RepID=UPI001BD68F4C|nr:23S rRNA (adenine(2030)-N(6))-methyltransferase RlmJ [Halomonas jincaotanensis]MBS9403369.1 23S rRNA (adenine(2030)-N(6))-methyltransferase RlmJ [Halomonas jincaotanensis]
MLSYQHAYHAGNFADVHKHLTLFAVIDHLLRKASPITYIDTHAGRGLYPLAAEETARLQEYQDGVVRLWQARNRLSETPLLGEWLSALGRVQDQDNRLDYYPGSPWWLSDRLRQQDSLKLIELHPVEHGHLMQQSLPSNVQRLHGDGLKELDRRLPVKTPRLCVLIDPSYERKDEYDEVARTAIKAMAKVRHAVLLIWYPLLPSGRHRELLDALRTGGLRKVWRSELIRPASLGQQHGMQGSGMLVINPPWGLEERLVTAMSAITLLLGEAVRYQHDWWVVE